MEKPIIITQDKLNSLWRLSSKIIEILENVEVRELNTPKLSKAEQRKLKVQELFNKKLKKN